MLAGLRYQPGYIEADVILSAAAIEALASRLDVGEAPRLSPDDAQPILDALDALTGLNQDQRAVISQMMGEATRTTLHAKTELLLSGVNTVAVENSRVSVADWLPKFKRTRNHIAHGTGGSASDVWTDTALLRAVRDANRVLLSLAFLTHLGVPDAALERAAERLGNRYSGRHRTAGIFR
ncbi:HEPN domain-containing protein [Microbacterium aurum]